MKYKFRCSSLGKLMTEPRSKSPAEKYAKVEQMYNKAYEAFIKANDGTKAKENANLRVSKYAGQMMELEPQINKPWLSETTKKFLREEYLRHEFDREKIEYNKFMEKGHYGEEDSITLLSDLDNKLYMKNKDHFENDYITGTPDIVVEDQGLIIDIKTKWDIFTFMEENNSNMDYYWQLQGYMWLTGNKKAQLVFTLVDTPEHLIFSEYTKWMYKFGLQEGSKEMSELEERVRKNNTYSDINAKKKIKRYDFEYNQSDINRLKKRIEEANVYVSELSLN